MIKKFANRLAVYAVCAFVGLSLSILGLAVIFRLLDADMTNSFVNWTLNAANDLVHPFRAIFGVKRFGTGHVLEFSYMFAIVVYSVAGAWLISLLAKSSSKENPADTKKK